MNFKDKWAVNEDGEDFIFTVEMQRALSESGLPVEPSQLGALGTQSPPSTPSPTRIGTGSDTPQDYAREEGEERHAPRSRPQEVEGPATIQIDPQTGKYIGRMKWYNMKKGYGFIVRGAGEEIFFHKTGTVGDPQELQEGQWILYDVEETHKGPEATEVEPYEGDVDQLE